MSKINFVVYEAGLRLFLEGMLAANMSNRLARLP